MVESATALKRIRLAYYVLNRKSARDILATEKGKQLNNLVKDPIYVEK